MADSNLLFGGLSMAALNPPFHRYQRPIWMLRMAEHGNGIMLIPAATETEAWNDYVWNRSSGVCFLRGRPHFHYVDGSRAKANSGCSIALIAYGKSNLDCLQKAKLGFVLEIQSRLP